MFRARAELTAHPHAVGECPDVQVLHLKRLGQIEHGQRMVGLVCHIKIALLIHVIHHVLDVILDIGSELMHAIQEPHERLAKVLPHHGPPEDPGEEVPGGDMVDNCLVVVCRRGRGDVQVDCVFRVGAPYLKLSRCSWSWSIGDDEETLNQGEALLGEQLLEGESERRPLF